MGQEKIMHNFNVNGDGQLGLVVVSTIAKLDVLISGLSNNILDVSILFFFGSVKYSTSYMTVSINRILDSGTNTR